MSKSPALPNWSHPCIDGREDRREALGWDKKELPALKESRPYRVSADVPSSAGSRRSGSSRKSVQVRGSILYRGHKSMPALVKREGPPPLSELKSNTMLPGWGRPATPPGLTMNPEYWPTFLDENKRQTVSRGTHDSCRSSAVHTAATGSSWRRKPTQELKDLVASTVQDALLSSEADDAR